MIHENTLYVANVGDSRVILCTYVPGSDSNVEFKVCFVACRGRCLDTFYHGESDRLLLARLNLTALKFYTP